MRGGEPEGGGPGHGTKGSDHGPRRRSILAAGRLCLVLLIGLPCPPAGLPWLVPVSATPLYAAEEDATEHPGKTRGEEPRGPRRSITVIVEGMIKSRSGAT